MGRQYRLPGPWRTGVEGEERAAGILDAVRKVTSFPTAMATASYK